MAEKIVLDEQDIKLLRACKEKSGRQLAEILAPFLGTRSQRTLYRRIQRFENAGLVEIDRKTERGRALCRITDEGKEILVGRLNRPDQEA